MFYYFNNLLRFLVLGYIAYTAASLYGVYNEWRSDEPSQGLLRDFPNWYYEKKIGPITFYRNGEVDPSTHNVLIRSYITIEELTPAQKENSRLSLLHKGTNYEYTVRVNDFVYHTIKYFLLIGMHIELLVSIIILILMRKFVYDSGSRSPFTNANSKRLSIIAQLMIGFGIIASLLKILLPWVFETISDTKALDRGPFVVINLLSIWLIVGLFILIVDKAYQAGIRLREEQRYTV